MVERILIPLGLAIILLGALTVIAVVPSNAFGNNSKTGAKTGGVILLGPIPIKNKIISPPPVVGG